ncbi:MAG TPA: hypothetical protein EYQ02_05840 [Microbacterium sp.]|nr:hypothetical protein [Microbacterium sp.]
MGSLRIPHALLVAAIAFASQPVEAADESLCGPFDSPGAVGLEVAMAPADIREQGVTTSFGASGGLADLGTIVRLPTATSGPSRATESGAILALAKNEAGEIPSDFELGKGAEIRESFFSPVICATVARVAGPAGATIEQLVTVVPEGSALVRNDIYSSASTEIRAIGEPPAEPDPYASLQYGLALSGVREARHLSTGAGVKIALLDSAPETAHRDLSAARIRPLVERGEAPEVGIHGTLMAGVINAIEGNGFGIAGMAPDAELISIPICSPRAAGGRCTLFDLLKGLDRAWDEEASIVNLSLSGPPNILLARGVARLEELGAVVVAAAGNEGTDEKRYPAAYPSVIGVGAIDREGQIFEASNRGGWVELAAPGVDVLSTVPGNAFAFGNGTSLAAAHVTGALAVLSSATGDPKRARGELFRAAHSAGQGRTPALPTVCEIFKRLDLDCQAAAPVAVP